MKKYIARMLSCALVLGMLSTAALAVEVNGYQFSNDVLETSTFVETGAETEYPLYIVPIGTKISYPNHKLHVNWTMDFDGDIFFGVAANEDMDLAEYTVSSTEVILIAFDWETYNYEYREGAICVQGREAGAQPTTPADTAPSAPADTAPTAPADTTPAATNGTTYTVVKYDTLGQIALNNYGSYKYHTALYKANSEAFKATGGALKPGMTLTLPDTLGNAKRIGMPVAGDGETLYTVKAGDTLGGIAKAVYGDVMKYQAIFERNSDRLKNVNSIYEGQIIVLPAKQ